MATLTFTPDPINAGNPVLIDGDGFAPLTACAVTLVTPGGESVSLDVVTDEVGSFASSDEANPATATLTSDATNVTANDTVTIGAVTYTFKASVTTTANEVKIGADAAATLANLKAAINLDPAGAANYGSLTVVHPTVTAGAITATTLFLYAKTPGTAGNTLVSTEASTHLSFGDTTFIDTGSAATGRSILRFTPGRAGIWTVTAYDGTTTVNDTLQVWQAG